MYVCTCMYVFMYVFMYVYVLPLTEQPPWLLLLPSSAQLPPSRVQRKYYVRTTLQKRLLTTHGGGGGVPELLSHSPFPCPRVYTALDAEECKRTKLVLPMSLVFSSPSTVICLVWVQINVLLTSLNSQVPWHAFTITWCPC